MNFIQHILGLKNASGPWYLWWSGIFGDVAIFGALILVFIHHNCHVKGCWRTFGFTSVDPKVHAPACKKHHSLGHMHGTSHRRDV